MDSDEQGWAVMDCDESSGHEHEALLQGRRPEAACCGRAHAVHHQDDEREVHEPALPSIVPRGPSTNQPSASRRNGSLVVLNGASHVLV